MNSLTRLVGYALLLLLVFLGAMLGAQAWLHRQSQRLRAEAVASRRAQFQAVLDALPRPAGQWDEGYRRQLGAMIGGTVRLYPGARSLPPERDTALLAFDRPLDGGTARVTFAAPATDRLLVAHQFVTVGLLLFGLVLLGAALILATLTWRTAGRDRDPRSPWTATRAEMGSLEHLARTSVAQSAELDHERDGRRRAEEDALLRQRLLNQSLEEKINLGRDLHDGIIQSLYAAGLTIESARTVARTDPAEADRRLGQCLEHLNATIRDVRAYIAGLAPENLRHAGFAQAMGALLTELGAGRDVQFDVKIDADAAAMLSPAQGVESLQVAREAVSNSLRHSNAARLTVRLHKSDCELCLLIQDDGRGFDPARRAGAGHGLGNMQARAARLGATLRVASQPGDGTRVILTFPALQTA